MKTPIPEEFVQQFFGPPNRLTVELIKSHPSLKIFAEYLVGTTTSTVLPYWKADGLAVYYAFAADEHEFRQLGSDLEAFVGCSFSTFSHRKSRLDLADPIDRLVRSFVGPLVYRFESDPGDQHGPRKIREKLQLMQSLQKQRQNRQLRTRLPLYLLFREYYMALEAGNRSGAEKVLADISKQGSIDAVNLLFLRTQIICRLGNVHELMDSGEIIDLLAVRRPISVSEALISALYRADFKVLEERSDVDSAISTFKGMHRRAYQSLYKVWQGMRSADAAKSFMLAAASEDPPNLALREAILERSSDFSPNDLAWISKISEAPVFNANHAVPDQSQATNFDAQLRATLEAAPSLENLRTLCRYAVFSDSIELRAAIKQRYDLLDAAQKDALKGTRAAAAVVDAIVDEQTPFDVPSNWLDWCRCLDRFPNWSRSDEYARMGGDQWNLTDDATSASSLKEAVEKVQENRRLLNALPHILHSARRDPEWPRREWREFYGSILQILATYTDGSINDLVVWSDLVEAVLALGISASSDYRSVCDYARELWRAHGSPSVLDWATELVDLLLYYPCRDSEIRDQLFVDVVSRAHAQRRLLTDSQRAYLFDLARDLGHPEWENQFVSSSDGQMDDISIWSKLSGKTVAIYCLTERVVKRTASILTKLCPGVDVRGNSDRGGSAVLKSLCKNSHLMVVVTASATHAATNFISAHRGTRPIIMHNSRGSESMIRAVANFVEESSL